MNINKFYLIDKPLNITSFDVIRQLRKKLNQRKMGHTGTLDPLASGVLLVAVGNYTKLIPYLEKDTKEYEFTINLDGISPSFDLGTDIEYISLKKQVKYKKEITKDILINILKEKFTGEIEQIPPKYSALKIGGKRALERIKKGEEFEMKRRKIFIYKIDLLDYKYPEVKLVAKVSAGTYIRSIAYDLGKILGTGGYISKLRRTKIGDITLKGANNLLKGTNFNKLNEKLLFGVDKFITLDDLNISRLNDGLIRKKNLNIKNGDYFIENKGNITNIINYSDGIITPLRNIL